jgi:hypothetical protein
LSLLGVRQGANARIVIASSFIVATGLVLIATQVADTALDVGVNTYERATSDVAMAWNQRGGSGVVFTGVNPWLAFPLKPRTAQSSATEIPSWKKIPFTSPSASREKQPIPFLPSRKSSSAEAGFSAS